MAILVILIGIVGLGIWFCEKKHIKNVFLPFTIISVFAVSVYLYRDFLFGDALYLYTTSDGYSQFLPKYMELIRTLRSGTISFWSFTIGFGHVNNYNFLLYPLNVFPVVAGLIGGEIALAHGFAWMQVLKMVLAALFMYLFLKKIGVCDVAAFAAAFVYGLNGIMITRGFWIYFSDECYLAVLILYVAELYYRDNKWYLLPPVIFLVAVCLHIYYVILYALLLVIYGTVRYVYDKKPAKDYFRFLLLCGGLYLLGGFISSYSLVGFSWNLFDSARFYSTSDSIGFSIEGLMASWAVIASAIFSVFDPNVTGEFYLYSGVLNYLERPLFYCGIGCLYFIVQALTAADNRVRRLILFGIGFAAVYMIFTPVTDLFNGFIRNEELGLRAYRLSSLWILIVMVVVAAYGMDSLLKKKNVSSGIQVCFSLLLIAGFLFMRYVADHFGIEIYEPSYIKCLTIIILWGVAFCVMGCAKKRQFVVYAMIFLVSFLCFEVACSGYRTINRGEEYALSTYQLMEDDVFGFYGDVNEAIDTIQTTDTGLYRISGVRPKYSFCAPQYIGFFDSSYYLSISSSNYKFLNELYPQSFTTGVGIKCSIGVGENLELSALTGYRYRLVDNTEEYLIPQGYKYIFTAGKVDVLENEHALSFGLTYDRYIPESVFNGYSDDEQRKMLLYAVVLEDGFTPTIPIRKTDDMPELLKNNVSEFYSEFVQERSREMLSVTSWGGDEITGTISVSSPKILSFSISDIYGWKIYVDGVETEAFSTNLGFFGIELDEGVHEITLKYTLPSQIIGAILSVVSMLGYWYIFKRRDEIMPYMEIDKRE